MRPLDLRYGAGELNLYNAWRVLEAGPRDPSDSLTHPARGWTLATTGAADTAQTVFFEIPAGNIASRFAAALVWHRDIIVTQEGSGPPASRPYAFTPVLPNLTLRLHTASAFNVGPLVAESASPVDNLEHLHQSGLAPGRYALVVHTDTAGTAYGLAWFSAPTVSATTTAPAHLARDSSAAFSVRFSRAGGDTSIPLRLPLAVTGTAVSGTHYTPAIPAEFIIPAGQSFADLALTPVATTTADAPSATLQLTLAADYASAPDPAANTVSLTLHARSRQAWLALRFSPAQLVDPAISGDTADPDADGLENLLEYALAADPLVADSATRQPVAATATDGRLTLAYLHAADRPDLTYAVEWTNDLAAGPWQTGAGVVAETSRAPVADGELVTVRAESAPADAPRQFLRLRVTRQ